MFAENLDLLVVMPAYNEQDAIKSVIDGWIDALKKVELNFQILVINDGSTDRTSSILNDLNEKYGKLLHLIHRSNKGHGQTCIEGYRLAAFQKIPFILQIDSDGQCDPLYFEQFWKCREDYDVIYGNRQRQDGTKRIFASLILKLSLRGFFAADCRDPNVPYRLMRTETCKDSFDKIPEDFFLANVALAVVLRKDSKIRHGEVPINFRERLGGEPSVPFSKFALRALELFFQLRHLDR